MWIKRVKQPLFILLLALMFSVSAEAATKPWATLTPMQQEPLAPIANEWDSMPETQQKRLLAASKRYHKLMPAQKQRFLNRLTDWSKLTPEQRNRAREKYKAFQKVPADKREEVKRMVRQSEAAKVPASSVNESTSAAANP
jgi:hypothetical protein